MVLIFRLNLTLIYHIKLLKMLKETLNQVWFVPLENVFKIKINLLGILIIKTINCKFCDSIIKIPKRQWFVKLGCLELHESTRCVFMWEQWHSLLGQSPWNLGQRPTFSGAF